MDLGKTKLFVKICVIYAGGEMLNLTSEQLHCLFKECLEMAVSLGDILTQATACGLLGAVNWKLSRFDEAIKYYEFDMFFTKLVGNKIKEGHLYGNLGDCCYSLGRYEKAICHHEMRLNIAKQIGDKKGECIAYGDLGNCNRSLSHYDKAIQHFEMQLKLAKQTGDKADEGSAHNGLGKCYTSLGKYDKAKQHLEVGLNIAKHNGDKTGEGSTHNSLGKCYLGLGQYCRAKQHLEEELYIAKHNEDKEGERSAYSGLGYCYDSLGQYEKAIQQYEMSLHIAKQIGDKSGEGSAYSGLGNCYNKLGEFEKAIEHVEMGLKIAKQTGDKAGEGSAHNSLGACYNSLGQYEKAIQHIEMGLKLAKQTEAKEGVGPAYNNLGSCCYSLGKYKKAIQQFEIWLNIAKQTGDTSGEGLAYGNLGTCYRSIGQYNKAKRHHEMHLNFAKQTGDKAGEGIAHGNLGNCCGHLGQHDKAMEHYQMHLNIAKQIGDKAVVGLAYRHLGTCYLSLEEYEKAEQTLKESVLCYEELFENVPKEDEFKISIRDTFILTYKLLVRCLLLQGKKEEALFVAELGRARALADLMFTSYSVQCTKLDEVGVLKLCDIFELVKALGSTVLFLSLDIYGICTWIVQPTGNVEFSYQSMKAPTDGNPVSFIENELNKVISKARLSYRLFCTNCEDRSLSFLYPDEMVEQTPSKQRTGIQPSIPTPIEMTVPMRTSAINPFKAQQRDQEQVPNNSLQELYHIVLGPVRELIEGPQVVIVADGALHMVPFAALVDDKKHYVAESLQVRLIPSLATAKMIMEHRPEPKGGPLVVGDPDTLSAPALPYARKEALMIGQLLGVQPLVGTEATKEKILHNLENANLIHMATHGDMKRGEILLAQNRGVDRKHLKKEDYMLMISDLEKMHLRAKLVVLSCCHSARGEVRAEGVIGIARAFLGAGARSVLVALWAIDDEATLYFMRRFYEHLSRGEKTNVSLNKAMTTMRERKEFQEPRYWAPFVLIGDDVSLV